MSKNTMHDDDYLKDFDFNAEGVRPIKHPLLQKIQLKALLADDVAIWLSQQNADTKNRVNEVIRHFMAVSAHD